MAIAALTATLSPAGNGVFNLQASGMSGAAAMDIVISYDAATLANPHVKKGPLLGGAMMAANPSTPGIIRIAAISTTPITGSGILLTVTFGLRGGSQGVITGLDIRLADINGGLLPSSAQIRNPPNPPDTAAADVSAPPGNAGTDQPAGEPPTPDVPSTGGVPLIVIAGGTVSSDEATGPQEQEREQPSGRVEDTPQLPPEEAMKAEEDDARPPDTGAEPESAAKKAVYIQKGVLDLFREYRGVRTAKAMLSLFDQESMIGFRQKPRVALSDGSATVSVSFITTAETKKPELSLQGLRRISLRKDEENSNTWVLKARAEKNAVRAVVIVPQAGLTMEIPVTVAPGIDVDMDGSGKVTEEDFGVYLRGPSGKTGMRFDLNGDGSADYIDDYIFTANYLVKNRPRPAKNKNNRISVRRRQ